MNNLHRELAPISDEAWENLEAEARRTFTRHVAARRVVDVIGPAGLDQAAVGTGHLHSAADSGGAVQARVREARPLVEFRAPFTVSRQAVDDVARGAKDPDWQPVKDAAKQIAFAEDGMVFDGFAEAGVVGIRLAASNPPIALPGDAAAYPDAVAQAMTELRLAGVAGPYTLLLSADAYTAVAETTDHGYPIREHLSRVLGKESHIIWAPALTGGLLLSTRGGDYELHLGQDLSIGYLSHDASEVQLYFQESLTFFVQTTEAGVELTAG
ncbi:family 1 encapsulin nanocompartment shell protein [Catellatospora sichuanensis]|uniref:family 1 encapsulin nanocompartment shell protein n=1 Tax=Catellatospora sichuanensis TaxID=1969805 RepID=UPI0011831C2B|nr:family 1 encapsulin nanocompartment shell protein [Catellatospora sichuanensis]